MALTPQQQLYADTVQQGIPSNCCLTLGGYMEPDDEGNDVCFLDSAPAGIPSQFYLSEACGQLQTLIPNMETPGGDGGGLFNWIGSNFEDFTDGLTNVIDSITGQPQQPPVAGGGMGTGTGVGTGSGAGQTDNTIFYIIGGLLVLLVIFLVIRKSK